jgi:hypothetical protein
MVLNILAFVIFPSSSSGICGDECAKNQKDGRRTRKGRQRGTFQCVEPPLVLPDLVSDPRPRALYKDCDASASGGWQKIQRSLGFFSKNRCAYWFDGSGNVLVRLWPFLHRTFIDNNLNGVNAMLSQFLYDDGVKLPCLPSALNEARPFRLSRQGAGSGVSLVKATAVTQDKPRVNILGILTRPTREKMAVILRKQTVVHPCYLLPCRPLPRRTVNSKVKLDKCHGGGLAGHDRRGQDSRVEDLVMALGQGEKHRQRKPLMTLIKERSESEPSNPRGMMRPMCCVVLLPIAFGYYIQGFKERS